MAENANDEEKRVDLAIKVAVATNNEEEPPNGVPIVANVPVIPAISRMKIEIVGLHDPLRGRMCDRHPTCGEVVGVNTILRLKKVRIWVWDHAEDAIAAYLLENGTETCRVGFLRRHAVKYDAFYEGRLVQVVALAWESPEQVTRRRSYAFKGLAKAVFI